MPSLEARNLEEALVDWKAEKIEDLSAVCHDDLIVGVFALEGGYFLALENERPLQGSDAYSNRWVEHYRLPREGSHVSFLREVK